MPIPYPKTTATGETAQASSSRLPDYPPSEASSDDTLSSLDSEEEEQAAMIQEEWEESLRQLEVVLSIILLPTVGKWYGRRAAYWSEGPRKSSALELIFSVRTISRFRAGQGVLRAEMTHAQQARGKNVRM